MKKLFLLSAMLLSVGRVYAEDNEDFGVWTELAVDKHITNRLNVGFEGEIRTENNSSSLSRLSGGINASYKLSKYFKVGACYTFYGEYSPEKIGKEEYEQGNLVHYRLTPGNWRPNHRVYVEVSGTKKFWRWLRISVRERYQYNYETEKTVSRTEFERDVMNTPSGLVYGEWEPTPNPKTYSGESQNRLRSRLKLEYDKKGVAWSPFVSVEAHNSLDVKMHLHRLRTCSGIEYKINKQNKVGCAYLYTCHFDSSPNKHKHALNLSYAFDF